MYLSIGVLPEVNQPIKSIRNKPVPIHTKHSINNRNSNIDCQIVFNVFIN